MQDFERRLDDRLAQLLAEYGLPKAAKRRAVVAVEALKNAISAYMALSLGSGTAESVGRAYKVVVDRLKALKRST